MTYSHVIVRIPNWLGDIVLSTPSLSMIDLSFKNIPVTLIGKKEFLPFVGTLFPRFETIEFVKKDHQGLWGIRQFCKKKIKENNGILYITLAPSFSSAYMGWSIKGAYTVGYEGNFRSWLLSKAIKKRKNIHRANEYKQLISAIVANQNEFTRDYAREFRESSFSGREDKDYIVINVNSEASSRRVPTLQWKKLLTKCLGHNLVFIGTQKERNYVSDLIEACGHLKSFNLAGKTDIIELCRVFVHAKGLISNDSGPAHLAALMNCPTAVFFGAGDENSTCPIRYGSEVIIIRETLDCSPCLKNKCPKKTLDCLYSIDMDQAFLRVAHFFNRLRKLPMESSHAK